MNDGYQKTIVTKKDHSLQGLHTMEIELRIKGTPSELVTILKSLGEEIEPLDTSSNELDTQIDPGWTNGLKSIFWAKLSPGCQALFKKLSERPNGYWDEELKTELGIRSSALGGSLSSVGLNMRGPIFRDKQLPWPVKREHREDTDRSMYILEPDWRQFVMDVLD